MQSLPYFLLTRRGDIVFAIYFLRQNQLYIGFPKLLASSKKTRVSVDGRYYKRIRGYENWFISPPNELKQNLKFVSAFNTKLFCFRKKEIEKIYHPLEFRKILKENKDSHIIKASELVRKITRKTGVSDKMIGVEGSTLLSCYTKNSDIDIIMYGYSNAKKLLKNFYKLDGKQGITLYKKKDYAAILKKRKNVGYGNENRSIIEQELRRFYGFIGRKKFSVISVLSQNDRKNIKLERRLISLGVFEGNLKIVETSLGCVTPSVYYGINQHAQRFRIEIISPYGINQAKKGETFFVKGNLYVDAVSNEKIIVIAFWNKIKQYFSLIHEP